jgi:hypothetical protein
MTAGRKIISDSQDWCTPPKYVNAVRKFFGEVYLDPCSNPSSIVQAKTQYMLPDTDGLQASWNFPTIYVNPPYGKDQTRGTSIKQWIQRCADAHQEHHSEVLALIPVAVNTRHWKQFIFGRANSICFLADTRLKFINGKNDKGAPMACAIIYWGKDTQKFYHHFSEYGAVVNITDLQKKRWISPDLRHKQQTLFLQPRPRRQHNPRHKTHMKTAA